MTAKEEQDRIMEEKVQWIFDQAIADAEAEKSKPEKTCEREEPKKKKKGLFGFGRRHSH